MLFVAIAVTVPPRIAGAQSLGFISQWGALGAGAGQFNTPIGITTDPAGRVYVTDYGNARVQIFTADGVFLSQWSTLGHGFSTPTGVAVSPSGEVYVSEHSMNRIQVFSSEGAFIRLWGTAGSGPGQFTGLYGIALGPDGLLYAADTYNARIQVFTGTGEFVMQWAINAQPWAVATDPAGRVYVGVGSFVKLYSSTGSLLAELPMPAGCSTRGIAATLDRLYVANGGDRVCELTSSGAYVLHVGGRGSGPGQFNNPTSLCVDAAGNILVTDTENHRVQKFGDMAVQTVRHTWGRIKAIYR